MLKMRKHFLQLFLLAAVFFTAVLPASALAAASSAVTQNGLTVQLTSPQDSYQEGEYIPLSLSVKNGNDYSLMGITAQIKLEGVSLKYGPLERQMQLAAGEESDLQPVVVRNTMPQTGDRQNPALWIALVLLSAGGLLFLSLRHHRTAHLLSLLLCAALACVGQPVAAQAEDVYAVIDVSLQLTAGGARAIATGTVTYPLKKAINVVGGVINETGQTTGTYPVGSLIQITADSHEGVVWNLTGGTNLTAKLSDDPTNRTLIFQPNGDDVSIGAVPYDGLSGNLVTVQQMNGDTKSFCAKRDEVVNISAIVPNSMAFEKWVNGSANGSILVHFANSADQNTSFTMPAGSVFVQATGASLHQLTVNGGTGGGWYKKDASVTINAGGHLHSGWHWAAVGMSISPIDSIKDYFVVNMPANDVTITMTP